jgi:hypothetical protein
MGSGYVGLLPEARHGNSTLKLPEASRTLMQEFILADYETLKQKTVYASWLALKSACDQKGVFLPSYKTYRLTIRRRPVVDQTLKRQGPRAAYQQERPTGNLISKRRLMATALSRLHISITPSWTWNVSAAGLGVCWDGLG